MGGVCCPVASSSLLYRLCVDAFSSRIISHLTLRAVQLERRWSPLSCGAVVESRMKERGGGEAKSKRGAGRKKEGKKEGKKERRGDWCVWCTADEDDAKSVKYI